MALKSSSFSISKKGSEKSGQKKAQLLKEHEKAIQRVIREAQAFTKKRKRTLDQITDHELRKSAAR
jgi:hypothetical protein